jgi:ubiquinone/menaquinone biosynthesis C-methylase UbiE
MTSSKHAKSSQVAPDAPSANTSTLFVRVLEPELMDTELEAKDYDRMNHLEVNARFVADLISLPVDVSRVLDVGTGTAQIPIELCRWRNDARVIAVDMAGHMLRMAAARVERAALSGVVTLEQRDAKSLGWRDTRFSLVMSNSLLHHLAEPALALLEMVRVLESSGWLFARDLLRPADDAQVRALVEQHVAGENPHQKSLFEASLRAALSLSELTDLARRAGIAPDAVQKTSDRHWTLAWKKR